MKTFTIIPVTIAILVIHLSESCLANDDKYVQSMRKNIELLYEAKTADEFQNAVNAFERIAGAEKSKWEPYYYAGFGYIMIAAREQDGTKKDTYLDQAMASINKARGIVPNESEVIVLEGFVHMIRVTVDPATRGQLYAPQAMQAFGKAIALNADNPRALALQSQMQFGTAQFFGSSTAEACASIDKALEKFETVKSDNPLSPQWGKPMAMKVKEGCK
jgi:tetratricopeptide (TPR) repeat protein